MQNVIMVSARSRSSESLIVLAMILTRIIYICPPNEVLIFSGGHRRIAGTSRTIGYRVVQGGRGIRIPLIEVVDRMDLTNMMIDLRVAGRVLARAASRSTCRASRTSRSRARASSSRTRSSASSA